MIQLETYKLSEVVDHDHLHRWREDLRARFKAQDIPNEVRDFIDGLTLKMQDFGRIRTIKTMIIGSDLLLCGTTIHKGEKVDPWQMYDLQVPYMVAVDHRTAMHRIYQRKGKAGLIGWVKTKLAGTSLFNALHALNVHVFHEESSEFKKVMAEIHASKKLESSVEV